MRPRREGIVYGLMAAIAAAAVYWLVNNRMAWHSYWVWLLAVGAGTFVVYAADKLAAVSRRRRAPELMLNILAGLGGFAGAWAGIVLLRHKSNSRKHRTLWLVLIASTCAHLVALLVTLARR
ncbi:MAG TPA: DUF1294 domain-containing protein [Anaerolineae bacterium]|nr:DUF1294 domain-containing protein [Anaerolineae bacterium]